MTEKLQEPFEYFEFVQKPFDQKELIDAIKMAMAKSKRRPAVAPPTSPPVAVESGAGSADLQALNDKIAKMQAEIDGLKKQMAQLMAFIKQKLK